MKRRTMSLVLLAVLLVLGGGFRLYKLDEKSLWSDEIATIATSLGNSIDPVAFTLRGDSFDPSAPVPAVVYREKATRSHGAWNLLQTAEVLKSNVHPPLFFVLMNGWIHAVGLSPDALRLPAALLGMLAIPVIYWLALCLAELDANSFSAPISRQGFALLAAAMMAFSAYQVDHAQDARQYTLLIVLAMLAVGLAVGMVQRLKAGDYEAGTRIAVWPWLGLTIVLAAGLYSQYFFIGFAAFVVLYLAWQGRYQKRFLMSLTAPTVLVGLLLLPWWGVFKEQLVFLKAAGHYTAGLWQPLQLPEKLWRIACEFFLPDHPWGKAIPLLVGLTVLGAGVLRRSAANRQSVHTLLPAGLGLMLLWLLAVIGGQVVIDLLKQSHTATIRRYLLLASPACYLLMAYGLVFIGQRLKSRGGWLLAALLSGLMLGCMAQDTVHMLRYAHTSSDEFAQAARRINQFHRPGDIVLVSKSGAMAVGMAYYLDADILMRGVDVPNYQVLLNGTPLMRQLDEMLTRRPGSRIWLVLSHTAPSTRERLQAWLSQRGYQSRAFEKFPGVRLMVWQRG